MILKLICSLIQRMLDLLVNKKPLKAGFSIVVAGIEQIAALLIMIAYLSIRFFHIPANMSPYCIFRCL